MLFEAKQRLLRHGEAIRSVMKDPYNDSVSASLETVVEAIITLLQEPLRHVPTPSR